MKCHALVFSGKNEKNINLLSAGFAHSVLVLQQFGNLCLTM